MKSPILTTTAVWSTSLSLGYSFGWFIGLLIGSISPYPAWAKLVFSDNGGLLGLLAGGVISGYITAIILQKRITTIKPIHIAIVTLGWSVAFLIAISLVYWIGSGFD